MSMEWEGQFAYACPPHQMFNQVLKKFRPTKPWFLILMMPHWLKQRWSDFILSSLERQVAQTIHIRCVHSNPRVLKLHAWRLHRALEVKGLSERLQAPSSLQFFTGKWRVFKRPYESIDINPMEIMVLQIVDFLLHIF